MKVYHKNFIKLVHDKFNKALYLSRSSIPLTKFSLSKNIKKQVCVIPFRRDFLILYNQLKPSPLEKQESIDMLRILEYGYDLHLVQTNYFTHAVDTKKDLLKVQKFLKK